ncbi:MAG: RNA polymerase sigma factor [Gemmatimonadota bacterium]
MRPHGLASVGSDQITLLRTGLRIMALRALGDEDAADDVVQEALYRALSAVTPEIAADQARLGAYVGGVARHIIADAKRGANRFASHDAAVSAISADDDVVGQLLLREEQTRVRAAIQRLAIADQIVVRASFYEGLTPAEIAGRLNQPVARVRKRKSRALARLRDALLPAVSHEREAGASIDADDNAPVVAEGAG